MRSRSASIGVPLGMAMRRVRMRVASVRATQLAIGEHRHMRPRLASTRHQWQPRYHHTIFRSMSEQDQTYDDGRARNSRRCYAPGRPDHGARRPGTTARQGRRADATHRRRSKRALSLRSPHHVRHAGDRRAPAHRPAKPRNPTKRNGKQASGNRTRTKSRSGEVRETARRNRAFY